MAFVDCEGFESLYSNAPSLKEEFISIAAVTSSTDPQITAFGFGKCFGTGIGTFDQLFVSKFPGLVNKKTIFFNWHFKNVINNTITFNLLTLQDESITQVALRRNGDGSFSALRGSTVLATSPIITTNNQYYFLQLKVVIDSTNGEFIFKVDNSTVFNLTGINTQNTANDYVNRYTFNAQSNTIYIDNVVIYDDSGSVMNDFTEETRVIGQYPTGNGDTIEWTPNTSTNFSRVNQNYDGDTTYNFTDTVGHTDLFTYASLVTSGANVYAIKVGSTFRKDDANTNAVVNVVKSGGTIYEDPAGPYESSPSYIIKEWIMINDPNTSSPWTVSAANAIQSGIRRKL
jgi:hypothetical protein